MLSNVNAFQMFTNIDKVKFEWRFKDITKDDYNPMTQINLTADNNTIFTARGSTADIIAKENWESYKIPSNAITACGGWYAGGGSYYYAAAEKNNINIYVGYADEGLDVSELYKYKIVKSIPFEELDFLLNEGKYYMKFVYESSSPRNMFKLFRASGMEVNYSIDVFSNNPYYLRGDFDGDGSEDYILNLLSRKNYNDKKIIMLTGNGKQYNVSDMEVPANQAWYVHSKNIPLKENVYDTTEYPELIGDAVFIIKVEASSAMIYWDGEKFKSKWLGD